MHNKKLNMNLNNMKKQIECWRMRCNLIHDLIIAIAGLVTFIIEISCRLTIQLTIEGLLGRLS